MSDEAYWRALLSGELTGVRYDLLRALLSGCESLYGAGLGVYLGAEKIGLRRRKHIGLPTISIGNLSVGGTGKTPMTQYLVRGLAERGERPGVLSRGHGGSIAPRPALVSTGEHDGVRLTAAEAGDEALLLASSLPGVPVAVGKDRRESGALLIAQCAPSVIVLDDGFQYWQLARNLDIVLLDALAPFDNGHALPRGFLREPKSGLARAGAVIFTRAGGLGQAERSDRTAAALALAPGAEVFFADHRPGRLVPFNDAANGYSPRRPLLVSGIARPDSFEAAVRAAGYHPIDALAFSDHQSYGGQQMETIAGKIRDTAADSVFLTAKDAVKLSAASIDAPAFVLEIGIKIEDAAGLWQLIGRRCKLELPARAAD